MPVRDIYAELVEVAGIAPLLERADAHLATHEPVHALHFLEVVLELEPNNVQAMEGQIAAYEIILRDAETISKNNYEKDYMRTLISQTRERLAQE